MKFYSIQTEDALAAIGPYSQAIAAGNLLFVSGQLGMVPATGEMVGSDLASQARQAMENLKTLFWLPGWPWRMWQALMFS